MSLYLLIDLNSGNYLLTQITITISVLFTLYIKVYRYVKEALQRKKWEMKGLPLPTAVVAQVCFFVLSVSY